MTKIIKIEDQAISHEGKEKLRKFLLDQPKWHYAEKHEIDENASRFRTKKGVEQHWLWQAENQAHSWDDFIQWPNIKTDRAHLIMPGELFLCDLVGNQLWIGKLLKRGDTFKAEKIACISLDMNHEYGNCYNGYAVIPWDKIS